MAHLKNRAVLFLEEPEAAKIWGIQLLANLLSKINPILQINLLEILLQLKDFTSNTPLPPSNSHPNQRDYLKVHHSNNKLVGALPLKHFLQT